MASFFVTCAALGGVVLLLQLFLGLFGIGDGHTVDHHGLPAGKESLTHGLHLFSVRALSAGVAFFGVGGLAGLSTPLGLLLGIPLAIVSGGAATVAVAAVMRAMMRLEDDGTVQIHGAVGASGTVYLTIPGDRSGVGKVHVTLQNRLVELQAVTSQQSLPTGSRVLVIDVVGPDTVDVVPDPIALEVPNVAV